MSPTPNPSLANRTLLLEDAIRSLQLIISDFPQTHYPENPVLAEHIQSLFKQIVQIGQSCKIAGLELVARRLEPIFQRSHGNEALWDTALQGLLQQALEWLQQLLSVCLKTDRTGMILAEAQPMLDLLSARCDFSSEHDATANPPVDGALMNGFFETEILPILEQLETCLTREHPEQWVGEYCANLDILRGLGQFLEFPKLVEITQSAIADLRATPEDLPRIGQVVLLRLQGIYTTLMPPASPPDVQSIPPESSEQSAFEFPQSAPIEGVLSPVVADFLRSIPSWMDLIEADLFTLKAHWSLGKVNNLMRNLHTLKGAALGPELATIKTIAHSLETFIRILCRPDVELDGHLEVLLFQAYECLRQAILIKSMDTSVSEIDLRNRANSIFDQLQEQLGSFADSEIPLPSSTDLGVDIVHSIFAIEVEQRLQSLTDLIEQHDTMRLKEVLEDNAEIFLGIAEAFDLKGFGAIAHTTLSALHYHFDQVESIAQLALMDFRHGQQQILSGERATGGQPSAALQHLASSPAETEKSLKDVHTRVGLLMDDIPSASAQTRKIDDAPTPQLGEGGGTQLQLTLQELFANYYQQATFQEQFHGYLEQVQASYHQHQSLLTQLHDLTQSLLLQQQQGNSSPPFGSSETILDPGSAIQSLWELSLNEGSHLQIVTTKLVQFHRQSSDLLARYFSLLSTARSQLIESSSIPLAETLQRLSTWFSQLVEDYGKEVDLTVQGQDILIDPAIAQPLYDVLLHLLRNAFDHGIEATDLRRQRGKSDRGQILIRATQQGEQLLLNVQDDGTGLDFGRIGDRAVQLGLLSIEDAITARGDDLLDFIFEPGFSTASEVSDLSGRGVGLDVVRAQIHALQGSIEVHSTPDEGTVFTLRIPQFPLSIDGAGASVSKPDLLSIQPELDISDVSGEEQRQEDIPQEEMSILSLENVFGENLISVSEAEMPAPVSSEQIIEIESVSTPQVQIPEIEETEPAEPVVSQPSDLTPRVSGTSERVLDTKQLFVWQAGNIAFVLPYSLIEEHISPNPGQLLQVQQQRFLQWRNQILPVYRLSEFLLPTDYLQVSSEHEAEGQTLFLILRLGQQVFALESVVHHLINMPMLVVKPLSARGYAPLYIYGQTTAPTQANLVLVDVETLLHQALGIPEDRLPTALSRNQAGTRTPDIAAEEGGDSPPEPESQQSVLVIDDSKMVREILKMTLEGAGYQVLEAQNGQVALDLATQYPKIDLVVCDVAMPKMNGFDFLRSCRQYPTYAEVPIVMLSNCDGDVHQQLAFRLGAIAYFTKPYKDEDLLSTLRNLIKA
jgi:two-component system, chemotaxis family, sensor histidine kinase and response regulator PixL